VGEYLEARGRRANVLFGLVRRGSLALFAESFFMEGVELPVEASGAVRCRLAGRPTALVAVDDAHWLDVAGLARAWPRLVAELFERAHEPEARALLTSPLVLRPLDDLKDLILEYDVHADHLFDLGGTRPAPRRCDDGRFALEFPRGTLELTYSAETYEGVQREEDAPLEVGVRWRDRPLDLPRDEDTPWHDDDVAELAVLGSMQIGARPADVVALYRSVLPEDLDGLASSAAKAHVLNLWGVALRKLGALEEAVGKLEAAHRMVTSDAPPELASDAAGWQGLEQQVAYNLGYAKLQTTMKRRASLAPSAESEVALASYDVLEENRAVWEQCLALFERALVLDPSDVTAASQVRQVELLLAALRHGASTTKGDRAPRRTKKRSARRPTRGGTPWLRRVLVPGGAVALLGVILVVNLRAPPPRRAALPMPSATETPSARAASEALRAAAVASVAPDQLADAGRGPCSLTIEPPRPVPRGTVTAPRVARALGTGELHGTENFDATIREFAALYAPALEVRPGDSAGVGPVKGLGPERGRPITPYVATLVVGSWRDPSILRDGASVSVLPGQLVGHLLVWSHTSSRFACAGHVEATNAPNLVMVTSETPGVPSDDPLNRARLDLVEQGYRSGIAGLRALGD
jgi:tetratricopeptide (TPR) repeat protein